MSQTIRSMVLELQPETVNQLRALIDRMKQRQETTEVAYEALGRAIPLLHFMSVTIFADDQYDAVLVIEVNFDGPPGPFWAQFEAAFGEDLRQILRCGKTPRDGRGALFAAVTDAHSRRPIAPLLEALSITPAVGHQGNRGLDRARIESDGRIFAKVQELLPAARVASEVSQVTIHGDLRTQLLPQFSSLAAPPPPRFATAEIIADWLRVAGFACLVLLGLFVPGVIVSLILSRPAAIILFVILASIFASRLGLSRAAFAGRPAPSGRMIGLVLLALCALVAFAALVAAIGAYPASFHHWRPQHYGHYVSVFFGHLMLGLIGIVPTILGVLVAIRSNEARDAPQDAPPRDEAALRAMAAREDKITQNHMGSVVHLKPGVLRAILVPVALRALGLVLRVVARDGYLGSMRTIHFAHWAFISNGSRLMFFSNFDGSWESYLDDFIEKAHVGLTLAWTGCVGFPPTRFLILDGATKGRKFKAWARHSMAESLFWYSAYPRFTVNQIERQARVADGLRRPVLTAQEAATWAMDL